VLFCDGLQKNTKVYTFWHQSHDKPGVIPGFPGVLPISLLCRPSIRTPCTLPWWTPSWPLLLLSSNSQTPPAGKGTCPYLVDTLLHNLLLLLQTLVDSLLHTRLLLLETLVDSLLHTRLLLLQTLVASLLHARLLLLHILVDSLVCFLHQFMCSLNM